MYEDLNFVKLRRLENQADVKLKNEIINGGFTSGVTGWSGAFVTDTTYFLSPPQSLCVNQDTTTANDQRPLQDVCFPAGNKVYCRMSYKLKSVLGATCKFRLSDYGSYTNVVEIGRADNSTPLDAWGGWSGIRTVDMVSGGIRFSITVTSAINESIEIYIDDCQMIDLTETFGAGNEPTKEEMDTLVSQIGYFDGEITLSQKQMLNWQLAMIRQNRNAIIALGGTII